MPQYRPVPLWALASAITAPVILMTSAAVARVLYGSPYNPVADTMSALATGASKGVMTCGFVTTAIAMIVTASGLRALRPLPRFALAAAGCCGLAVAAFPAPLIATANAHVVAAGSGAVVLAAWPLLAVSAESAAPVACRTRWAVSASVVLCVLLAWMCLEMPQGSELGLAERLAVVADLLWPAAVVIAARRSHAATSAWHDRSSANLQRARATAQRETTSRS